MTTVSDTIFLEFKLGMIYTFYYVFVRLKYVYFLPLIGYASNMLVTVKRDVNTNAMLTIPVAFTMTSSIKN